MASQTAWTRGGQQASNRPAIILMGLFVVVVILLGSSFQASDSRSNDVAPASTKYITLTEGRSPAEASSSACKVSTQYLPSDLEQLWVKNAAAWEPDFCNHMAEVENYTRVWLDTLAEHTKLQDNQTAGQSPAEVLAQQQKMDPRVFSRFKTTYDCGTGETAEHIAWVEPLSHGLRHPNALCNRGTDVMDRQYLLLAHQADHAADKKLGHVQCANRACQAIYFDLGATTLQPTPGEAGQGWFYSAYKRQGITFDRFLLWEAVTQNPTNIYQHVPKADMHKYQYFNIPVTPEISDPSNPVNMLKAIAQPGDFVVFKLDIDNFGVEHAILDGLRKDPQALALIDEFFFEEHVKFAPMLPYWGGSVGPDTSLASSYAMFSELRQRGVRAHSWV